MPADLVSLWFAYDRVEPFGAPADDARTALIAWLLAEPHRDRKKRKKPYELSDFILTRDPAAAKQPQGQSAEEILALVVEMNRAMGGADHRKQKMPEAS